MNRLKLLWCSVPLLMFQFLQVISQPATFNLNGNISNVSKLTFNINFYENNGSRVEGRRMEVSLVNNTEGIGQIIMSVGDEVNSIQTIPQPPGSPPSQESTSSDASPAPEIPVEPPVNVVLTAEEEMQLKLGVNLNFSLSETRSARDHPGKLISSPGCPASEMRVGMIRHPLNRDAWVQFGNPPRCFLVGTQGPCPDGMRIGHQPNSWIGVCKCSCYFNPDEDTYNRLTQLYEDVIDPFFDTRQQFCSNNGSQHFADYEGRCYQLNTRGPCFPNEVFVWDAMRSVPVCQIRDCPEAEITQGPTADTGYRFLLNGNCSREGDICQYSQDGVTFGGRLQTTKYNPNPTCLPLIVVPASLVPAILTEMMCGEGDSSQKFSELLQRCVPVASLRENVG